MTADSYSPTKEQIKDVKMVNNENKNVVLEVEERHFLFKCVSQSHVDKATHCLAEVFGTASLVFLCCMSCVEGLGIAVPYLQAALGSGLTVLVVVSIFGGISHCHVNPAVTLAAAICRLISIPMAFIYIICQFVGAIIGFGMLRAVTPVDSYFKTNSTIGLCMTVHNERITSTQALFIEIFITTLLIWLVCALWDTRNSRWQDSVALKFGFTIVTISIAAGPYTGASMNPARSLAPALFAGNFIDQWIYWAGPLIGSIFASLCYKFIFQRKTPKCCCTIAILQSEFADHLHQKN